MVIGYTGTSPLNYSDTATTVWTLTRLDDYYGDKESLEPIDDREKRRQELIKRERDQWKMLRKHGHNTNRYIKK